MTDDERMKKPESGRSGCGVSVRPRNRGKLRAGLTIMEATMAIFIVGVALSTAVELLTGVSRQQRRLERRDLACQEASNALERLTRQPWDESLTENPRDLPASVELATGLPEARLRVEAEWVEPARDAQRIRVTVVAPGPAGELETWAALVAWKYRAGGRP